MKVKKKRRGLRVSGLMYLFRLPEILADRYIRLHSWRPAGVPGHPDHSSGPVPHDSPATVLSVHVLHLHLYLHLGLAPHWYSSWITLNIHISLE